MLTKTMVYLGLPLVISVPQLFFPPQVEKFYLGRLSKGRYLSSMKSQKTKIFPSKFVIVLGTMQKTLLPFSLVRLS